jgi:hypothetical protein
MLNRHYVLGRGINMSNPKRMASVAAGIIVTLGVASVAGGGVASADGKADYLYDLSNAGIGGPTDALLKLGYQACAEVDELSRDESIARIGESTTLDEADATFLYESATQFLCP